MRRYRKNRCYADCDSLHSFYFDQPMTFGSIPIEIEEDYIRLTKKGIDFANIVWEEFV